MFSDFLDKDEAWLSPSMAGTFAIALVQNERNGQLHEMKVQKSM